MWRTTIAAQPPAASHRVVFLEEVVVELRLSQALLLVGGAELAERLQPTVKPLQTL